jgi:hypothetical protein
MTERSEWKRSAGAMPSKITRVRLNKKPGQVGPAGRACHWSPDQKEMAVAKWLILGNIMEVQRQTQIPEITLRKWKAMDWWKEKEQELRRQANTELEGKLGKVLNKSLEQTMDRLEHGDIFYNQKNGKFERVPVKANVVNQISKTMLDKKFILQQINSKSDSTEEAIADRLDALKKEFLSFAKKRIEVTNVIDITPEKQNALKPQLQA